jgi:hypothetical protein
MRLFKNIKVISCKPAYANYSEAKEAVYKGLCDLCMEGKSTRIPDVGRATGLDSVRVAGIMYELERLEKRVGSSVMPVDGHLYHVFFPRPKNPADSDANALPIEPERRGETVHSCPFETGRYLKIRPE